MPTVEGEGLAGAGVAAPIGTAIDKKSEGRPDPSFATMTATPMMLSHPPIDALPVPGVPPARSADRTGPAKVPNPPFSYENPGERVEFSPLASGDCRCIL
jgi:hypothetical protein